MRAHTRKKKKKQQETPEKKKTLTSVPQSYDVCEKVGRDKLIEKDHIGFFMLVSCFPPFLQKRRGSLGR
jgi:hypothetical protein